MHNNNYNEPTETESRDTRWHPNRSYLQLSHGIVIDSCFPGGNIASATITSHSPLTLELEGNTDISMDNAAKYWLYFHIRGYKKQRPLKLVLKNANYLRKFYGQSRYRPFLVYKQEDDEWKAMQTPLDLIITENSQIQASCTFLSQRINRDRKNNKSTNDLYLPRQDKITADTQNSNHGNCYFAIYYPYSYEDLNSFLLSQKLKLQSAEEREDFPLENKPYFHCETITYTFQHRKVTLITITSFSNVQSFSEKEPIFCEQIFPHAKDRPFKLKNNPVIVFTARVHPSQTSSSFFIEGLIQFLISNNKSASILRQMFIFQIIPMLNPDGVEHGNFRFDHEMRNLNRYYGQSSIQKTPSIRAAELLIDYYKNPGKYSNNQEMQIANEEEQSYCRLLMYTDVHGHSSALPSFLYGNHTQKLQHAIQNRMFCKLLESNFISNGFSRSESQFSKKNMTLQQKYDEFSKLCSGRVFAGRMDRPEMSIFHSYTLQILPFWEVYPRRKQEQKLQKIDSPDYARLLGKSFVLSVLDLLQLNPQSKFSDSQMEKMRKQVSRQCQLQQSRRMLSFKKSQSVVEKSSCSQLGKSKLVDQQYPFYNEYIHRWFSHQSFVDTFFSKPILLKEPKFYKFYSKIAKVLEIPPPKSICSSHRKMQTIDRTKLCESQHKTQVKYLETHIRLSHEKSQTYMVKQDEQSQSQQRILFVCRSNKDRNKIQTKVSKKTIELQNYQLSNEKKVVKRQYRFNQKQAETKRNIIRCHTNNEAPDRYEQQIILKINSNYRHNNLMNQPVFQIRAKEMINRQKHNGRIQTQTISSEPSPQQHNHDKINPLQSSHCLKANPPNRGPSGTSKEEESPTRHKPSFIQQFMMKIKAQRQSLNLNSQKNSNREQLKIKSFKLQSIKAHLQEEEEEQEKGIVLPILRKNKIFTVAKEATMNPSRGYESITQHRKRMLTQQQFHLDEVILKTKNMVTAYKKQQIIREQTLKKSQRASEYKCN